MKRIPEPHPPYFLAALLLAASRPDDAAANPAGLTVGAGSASLHQSGSQLNINVSSAAVLNWQSFNIAAGEKTAFQQPSADAVVLNVIGGASPSQIYGSLTANGTVILANANGFYFGPNSFVSVGGSFIATTAPAPQNLDAGAAWRFTGMPPLAGIVNYGQIQAGDGRSLYLIAEHIDNEGGLTAPGGTVDLAAGQQVLVSESPDGRGLSAAVTLPAGSVDNFGRITADGGSIAAQAQVVTQNGILQADSVKNANGVIELVASGSLRLGTDSQILARGDHSAGGSDGGSVVLRSEEGFSDAAGSQIVTTGGALGGNGGNVEVSAPAIESLNSTMDAAAAGGGVGGQLLLDPYNITLTGSGSTTAGAAPNGSGTVNGSGNGNVNWTVNVNTAFANKHFSQITLEASGSITLSTGLNWNLSATTGENAGTLTLEAGQNIVFGKNASITDAHGWNVDLLAGVADFSSGTLNSGTGNIYLNGGGANNYNGTIQTAAGSIDLWAGNSIQAGSGSVYTTAGGNLFAAAEAGPIYTGVLPSATSDYIFGGDGATPGAVLGGFSTGAGGNVTLIAGTSVSPAANFNTPSPSAAYKWPGESGAYGAGDVTVIAGNQIAGNYLLTDGTGTLLAGVPGGTLTAGDLRLLESHGAGLATRLGALATAVQQAPNPSADIGTASAPILLSESKGTWNVWSADDIYLNEINNPNGTFNAAQGFQFDYAPDAAAHLWADDAITLEGGAGTQGLPRTRNNSSMLPIYAPQLSLNAGAGGILLESSLILYPSTVGALAITTRNGGSLTGQNGAEITLSDSAGRAFGGGNDFTLNPATDATVPLGFNNPNGPVTVNVTGNWENLGLNLPEAAQINVLGNVLNPGLQVWNLHASDTTTLNAGAAAKAAMEQNGVLNSATDGGLTVGGDVNLNGSQWELLGPGTFNLKVGTLEMDASASITAAEAVAPVGEARYGSSLNVTTAGDVNLTTTTAILNSGVKGDLTLNVGVNAGGTLNIGNPASDAATQSQPTAGIFTSSGGDVTITAGGSINVGQSRIATYDGGNITVLTQDGSVNCGDGSLGVTYVNAAYEIAPGTGQLVDLLAGLGPNLGGGLGFGIPGSGIRANTFVDGNAPLGNILVEAPNGTVNASDGGIVALHFNSLATSHAADAVLEVLAGYELLGPDNQPLLAAGLSDTDTFKPLTPNPTPADPYWYSDLVDSLGTTVGQLVRVAENQNIVSTDSGIIGQVINAQATGKITGLFAGREVSVTAPQLGQVVVFSHDPPVISGDSLSGSEPIIVSPTVDTAAAPATAPSVAAPTADNATSVTAKTQTQTDDSLDPDGKKRRKGNGSGIGLAQKVSRVTVLLPENKTAR